MRRKPVDEARTFLAGLAAWLVPGAGHFVLGLRGFALTYFLAISIPFLVGLALGGVRDTVSPRGNPWLFLAELGVGSYTLAAWMIGSRLGPDAAFTSYYPGADVAQIYLSVAGLLNVLAILDALSRAQNAGLPLYYHELPPREASPQAPPSGGSP